MSGPVRAVRRLRDLLVLETELGSWLLAVDVAAGVGEKPGDAVRAPAYVVGRFTARVALAELLAAGAEPVALADPVGAEPEPTGREVLRGIRDEAAEAGLDLPVTGSTEKNLPVVQSSVGVVALGFAPPGALRLGPARPGETLWAVGRPKVGASVRLDDPEIADLRALGLLLASPHLHLCVPAGSGGVAAEGRQLALEAGLTWEPEEAREGAGPAFPLSASAGPATCLVAVGSEELGAWWSREAEAAARRSGRPLPPITRVGRLR